MSSSHTYPVAVGVVESLEFDDVGMAHNPHYLKLTVLRRKSETSRLASGRVIQHLRIPERPPYLEPFVLQDSLDGSVLAAGGHLGLKHDTERSIAHDLALSIRDLLVLACQAILDLFADDLCAGKEDGETSVIMDQTGRN